MDTLYSYPKKFKEIVELANEKSVEFYQGKIPSFKEFLESDTSDRKPNPYYIGFGNPGASILILGKEKGFDFDRNSDQAWRESIANPQEWQELLSNNISNLNHITYSDHVATCYKNALYPYSCRMKVGHTWSKYQKLIDLIYPLESERVNNSFLQRTFISEINHSPSKYSQGYESNEISEIRKEFLKIEYFQNFPVIILACGNYMNCEKIRERFLVNFDSDKSLPGQKLIIYKSDKRIIIHTRQLSMNIKPELFSNIAAEIKPYLL